MRILVFSWHNYWSYGGVQSFVRDLTRPSNAGVRFIDSPASLYRLAVAAANRIEPRERLLDALAGTISGLEIDAIYSHNAHFGESLRLVSLLEQAALSTSIPHVLFLHDVDDCLHTRQTLISLTHTRFATQSAYNRRKLLQSTGIHAALLPVGIPFSSFPVNDSPTDVRAIASPGRICPEKGILEALSAVGQYSEQVGPLLFLISNALTPATGQSGYYLKQLAEAARRFPQVEVQSLAPKDPVASIYQRASAVLLLPDGEEGFGLTALEALASGRPVIVRPVGGMCDWLQNLPGVQILKAVDSDDVLSALVAIHDDPRAWHFAAMEARAILAPQFDIAPVTAAHAAFFARLA